jgi:hypothetical protein
MKAYGEVDVQNHRFLASSLYELLATFTLKSHHPQEKIQSIWGLVGPRGDLEVVVNTRPSVQLGRSARS